MSAIKALLNYLKTLWGMLSTAAVLFPGAAALLKVPIAVSGSTIAALYPIIATVVAAFAMLLLLNLRRQLADQTYSHRLSAIGMALTLVCFFAFVLVRVVYLDVDEYRVVSSDPNTNVEVRESRSRGLVSVQHTELKSTSPDGGRKILFESKRGDPLDVLAMLLFTITFASLATAFTSLGIHAYGASRKVGSPRKNSTQRAA